MFDPTIFENIKVVLEGAAYDLDAEGLVRISGRNDVVDLAAMSRSYCLHFELHGQEEGPTAEISLSAGTEDLAAELLERKDRKPGCSLVLTFHGISLREPKDAERANHLVRSLWGPAPLVRQQITYEWGQEEAARTSRLTVDFQRSFDEQVIEDIPRLLEHLAKTLEQLSRSDDRTDS
ncbi:hypothetical protein [Gorillibacterium sp. CAU 1737]|uniref:hypothetical protein n=1 Tax=Gorillibacterium sp. CAU 1737 TaxID=3140362 RepID=UPI003261CD22